MHRCGLVFVCLQVYVYLRDAVLAFVLAIDICLCLSVPVKSRRSISFCCNFVLWRCWWLLDISPAGRFPNDVFVLAVYLAMRPFVVSTAATCY